MNLRLSRFCHFVDTPGGYTAIYNALTLGVVIVKKEIADILRIYVGKVLPSDCVSLFLDPDNHNLLEEVTKHKLVCALNEHPDLQDYAHAQEKLDCPNMGILYLLVTDRCNLECCYCFIENSMPSTHCFQAMSSETAHRSIDLFARSLLGSHGVEEPQIIFYGGEPFLNFPVVADALAYIAELKAAGRLPLSTSITINTNGTLIDQAHIAILKEVENLNVAISLDGPREVHDMCRPYHDGNGSFDRIMESRRLLRASGIDPGFCCTISQHNVDRLLEIAHWFVEELGVSSLGFNIYIQSGKNDTTAAMPRAEYSAKVAQALIECFCYFRENGVYEDRMMRKVNAFIDGTLYLHDCGGCGQQIVVAPNGSLGVCQGYQGECKNFIPPDGVDPLTHPLWQLWRHRSPIAMPQCESCIALGICGGGCALSAERQHGSIWHLDDTFCVHAKATVEFLLRDLVSRMLQCE